MRFRLVFVAPPLILAALLAVALSRSPGSGTSSVRVDQASAALGTDIVLTPHGRYTDRHTGLRFVLGPASVQSLTEDGVCLATGHPQDSFTARITVTNTTDSTRTFPINWLEVWARHRYITFGNAPSQPITVPWVRLEAHATRTVSVNYLNGVGQALKAVTIRWDDQSRVGPYPPPVVGTYSIAPSGFNPCSTR
jgi:hypothetical protein